MGEPIMQCGDAQDVRNTGSEQHLSLIHFWFADTR